MMTNRGIRKRYVVDLYKETTDKEGAKFPNEFEFVTDETQKIIGMDEAAARKVKAFEAEVQAMKAPAKNFADSIFENLFGAKTLDYSLPEVLEPGSKTATVKNPDEEEELVYTPEEDEILDDDDDMIEDIQVRTTTVKAAQDDRPHRQDNRNHQGRDNRGPRQDNRNQNNNRGPNPNQQNNNQGRPNNNNRRPR